MCRPGPLCNLSPQNNTEGAWRSTRAARPDRYTLDPEEAPRQPILGSSARSGSLPSRLNARSPYIDIRKPGPEPTVLGFEI